MASKGTAFLFAGDSIDQDDWIESGNGLFSAGMTVKGDFVIYAFSSANLQIKELWRMETANPVPGSSLLLHGAGRIEIHAPGAIVKSFRGCTDGSHEEKCFAGTDFTLAMQDDGNLVLRSFVDGTPFVIWASDTVVSDAAQSSLVIPDALVLELDQASIGGPTSDKTVLNNTEAKVIVRAGASQVTLQPNAQVGVVSIEGTVVATSSLYGFNQSMPDDGQGGGNISDGPAGTFGPNQRTITIGGDAGSGFTLT